MEQPEYEQMYQWEDTHWWFVSRRRLAAGLIEQWLPPPGSIGNILDVGCGTGGNLEYLARLGQAGGIDISPVALAMARRRRLPWLAVASGLALPYADGTFSLVTAFDVFYHRWIVDDRRAVQECYRLLRPGGWLLLTDSAMPSLWSAHDETYYARQRYTLSGMGQTLSEVGFDIKVCSYKNVLLLPVFIITRLMMHWLPLASDFDLRPPAGWLNRLLIQLHYLEIACLRRGRSLPLGSSLVCLGQKPDQRDKSS